MGGVADVVPATIALYWRWFHDLILKPVRFNQEGTIEGTNLYLKEISMYLM
jgi:hypothetical protein